MKILKKMTALYTVGFGFLIIIILVALFSFTDVRKSTEQILEFTENLALRYADLTLSESPELTETLEQIKSIRARAFIFFIFALLLSSGGVILLIYIYNKNIAVPLHRVTSATQKMARGEFEELAVQEGTEIGKLSENFNAMGQTLRNKIKELEKTIYEKQEVVRTLNILNELNSSIIFKVTVNEVLETVNSFSKSLLRSEISSIVLIDKVTRKFNRFFSPSPDVQSNITSFVDNVFNEVFKEGIPVRLSASSGDMSFAGIANSGDIDIKNVLGVPVIIKSEILGALILINKNRSGGFTEVDEDVALAASFQAAMAIEKAMLHEEIVMLAKTDGLTGLKNHRTFHEELDAEIKRARRLDKRFALLLMDIDYFKGFNDTYGHQSGDNAIRELSRVLSVDLRGIDSAARYGGDEFSAILPETSLEGGLKTAERIRQAISKHNIMGMDAYLTVSIGVAIFPADALNKEGLIKAADDAMYMATKMGRNRVVTYKQYKEEVLKSK